MGRVTTGTGESSNSLKRINFKIILDFLFDNLIAVMVSLMSLQNLSSFEKRITLRFAQWSGGCASSRIGNLDTHNGKCEQLWSVKKKKKKKKNFRSSSTAQCCSAHTSDRLGIGGEILGDYKKTFRNK